MAHSCQQESCGRFYLSQLDLVNVKGVGLTFMYVSNLAPVAHWYDPYTTAILVLYKDTHVNM